MFFSATHDQSALVYRDTPLCCPFRADDLFGPYSEGDARLLCMSPSGSLDEPKNGQTPVTRSFTFRMRYLLVAETPPQVPCGKNLLHSHSRYRSHFPCIQPVILLPFFVLLVPLCGYQSLPSR